MSTTNITIPTRDVTGELFFREEIGSGKYGDHSFDITALVASHDIHIDYRDHEYIVEMKDICLAICKEIIKQHPETQKPQEEKNGLVDNLAGNAGGGGEGDLRAGEDSRQPDDQGTEQKGERNAESMG